MKPIQFYFEAEEEMKAAAHYYNTQKPGLGFKFLDEITAAFNEIQISPTRWVKVSNDIRKFIVRKFPYKIYYEITDKSINILAISHQRQKPDYWKHRL